MDPQHLPSDKSVERVLLVGIQNRQGRGCDVEESLAELAELAHTAGGEVVECVVCRQGRPHPATYIGSGKAEMLAAQRVELKVDTIVFDDDLSPAQSRNLEKIAGCKILDRTQVILDIFARHAHTREGRLQIELAQLEYLLPRLRRMWTHLERQQGGIGLRGPGEKQLELDRRRVLDRIVRIRRDLEQVRDHRAELLRGRRRRGWALLTLVGYTNAGKSTLLNRLTGAQVLVDDKLFATLDPTTRQLELPNHQPALVTDTVGFIRKLPHHLVEAFKATLEEVVEADLLLHVIDASHPQAEQQIEAVEKVLEELGVKDTPVLHVLNKMDQDAARRHAGLLRDRFGRAVAVSALTGEGLDDLKNELADVLRQRSLPVRLRVPPEEAGLVAMVRRAGNLLSLTYDDEGFAMVEATVPAALLARCVPFQVKATAPGKEGKDG